MAKGNSGLSMPLCITDLLFNVIGFLILLIAISSFEEKMDSNERALELYLSQHEESAGMKASTAKMIINIFLEDGQSVIELDGQRFSLDSLATYLNTMGGAANVAIRCEENILVGFNNSVLAVCKGAGIENVDQVVKLKK